MSRHWKQTVKEKAKALLRRAGALTRHAGKRPLILFYHGVSDRVLDPRVQPVQMPLAVFETMMRFVRDNHTVLRLDEAVRQMEQGARLPRDTVVLTLDDGYKNNLTVAEPLLRSLGLPFCVYVSTRQVSEGSRFPTYLARLAVFYSEQPTLRLSGFGESLSLATAEARARTCQMVLQKLKAAPQDRANAMVEELIAAIAAGRLAELNARFADDQPMTWAEVRELAQRGVLIGSHTHDHAILHGCQSREEIERQLSLSRQLIEEQVGERCEHFCFPNGRFSDISPLAIELVRRAGYRSSTTTVGGTLDGSSSVFLLPRFGFEQPEALINHRLKHLFDSQKELRRQQRELLAAAKGV